ncbi:Exostosin-like [Macleaya cordata]|uniref:Exostosin-like n=1 Tax=Macleaya cordata TaxID=56857 RepID=A0A200Q1D3_MACCD|nr:Exostosin-like [Macleaya cordata]
MMKKSKYCICPSGYEVASPRIVLVSEIPNLKKMRHYIKMQRTGLEVRRHFEVNSPPRRFDVFHMILHSIWLRRLNVQIHDA